MMIAQACVPERSAKTAGSAALCHLRARSGVRIFWLLDFVEKGVVDMMMACIVKELYVLKQKEKLI